MNISFSSSLKGKNGSRRLQATTHTPDITLDLATISYKDQWSCRRNTSFHSNSL